MLAWPVAKTTYGIIHSIDKGALSWTIDAGLVNH